jgi:hypothetical protein
MGELMGRRLRGRLSDGPTRRVALVGVLAVLAAGLSPIGAGAGHAAPKVPAPPAPATPAPAPPAPAPPAPATLTASPPALAPPPAPAGGVRPADRDKVLPRGWRDSADLAWTTSGDGSGFHVLVAPASTGYTWRTVATLAEPGFDADQWIGNACLTGSGRRVVVTYAPRTFTNDADLFDRGGFTATVDLRSGTVTKLNVRSSLAYFSPGCGTGETAVVSQFGGKRVDDPTARGLTSRVITIDAAKSTAATPILLRTELSSPVPVGDAVVAAGAGRLVRVGRDGKLTGLAATTGVAFRLAADRDGGVVFMDRSKDRVRVKRTLPRSGAPVASLAAGPLTDVGLVPGAGGRVFLTGEPSTVAALPAGVRRIDVPAGSGMSSTGAVALTRVGWTGTADPRARTDAGVAREVEIKATSVARRVPLTFRLTPSATGQRALAGREPHPSLRPAAPTSARRGAARALGASTDPSEGTDERYCAVPRNDPGNQAMQPKPRQVEWAVDQAIHGVLTVTRPANWKNLGMPQYTPQGLFPPIQLTGGGRVPAQVMLGILAQESNMWQAPSFILPGNTGNPLIGNYYGRDIYNSDASDDWTINWADADCGYGVAQVTDGMRLAGKEKDENDTAYEYQTQRAVALDFAANVAAGVRILQSKWNQVRDANIMINNGDPAKIENWFFAAWAYNSGFHPDRGDGSPWGVGWGNNPINPRYDQQRRPFMEFSYEDARTPQRWPYPEKIMGWAGHPVEINETPTKVVPGYNYAWWITAAERVRVKPPMDLFCDDSNNCDPSASVQPNDPDVAEEPPGPCLHKNANNLYDLRCWYHRSAQWKGGPGTNCNACGNESVRFDPGYAYQEDGNSYPPNCGNGGLPAGAYVIDDVPDGTPSVRSNCNPQPLDGGSFGFSFPADATGKYPAKVDLHQSGGGYGAHFWFGRTRTTAAHGNKLLVSGTWRMDVSLIGWTRIKVHLPDHRAWTLQADYIINLGDGRIRHRVINQAWQSNTWIDLGVFQTSGRPSVTLTTATFDGNGEDSIAFDAVAFIPTSQPSAQYVAMGDSYASGEGVEPYDSNSDHKRDNGAKNACHRSREGAYPRMVTVPGRTTPIAQEAAEGRASFALIACSGALTTSVTDDAVSRPPGADDTNGHTDWGRTDRHWGELAQVDQGWLDEDTTLVTISIGGNDVRFGDVLHGCILSNPLSGCHDDGHRLTRRSGVVDPAQLKSYEKNLILDRLPGHLKATYRAIADRAPNAHIIVVGYPQLFPDHPRARCETVDVPTQRFLNTFSSMLTATIGRAVADVAAEGEDITFVDPTPRWRGGAITDYRWACPSLFNTWTNDIVLTADPNSGRETPGNGSYHPKREGQNQLAGLVNAALWPPSTNLTIAQRIIAQAAVWDRTVTPAQADYAARRCRDLTRRAGLVGDPCMTTPIFFTTVANAAGAAHNDADAIDDMPPWVRLNYVSNAAMAPRLSRNWFDTAPVRDQQTTCPRPRPTGQQCDEYPLYSSALAGAWDEFRGEDSPVSSNLRLIPAAENRGEGSFLPHFYSRCNLRSGVVDPVFLDFITYGSPYLMVPLLDPGMPNTFYIC